MEGKAFLITGGASGLGAATANAILENGAKHVIIFDIQENYDQKKEIFTKYGEDKYYFHNCDITSEEGVDRAFRTAVEHHGPIDCVVNNAGISNDKIFKQEIDINFTGLVRMTIKALEHMRIDKGGRGGTVINISSVTALDTDPQFIMFPVYCATKGAILHFTNCLALMLHCLDGEEKHREETCMPYRHVQSTNPHWASVVDHIPYPRSVSGGLSPNSGSKTTWDRTGVRLMSICYGPTDTPLATKSIACIADYLDEEFTKYNQKYRLQSPEVAIQTFIEAYKTGAPGSTWLGTENKPPQDITREISEAYNIMASCL